MEENVSNGGRVGKGISAQASHGNVREALTSYGSYYPVAMTLPIGLIPPILQWLIKIIRLDNLIALLHTHYKYFYTTTNQSATVLCIGI